MTITVSPVNDAPDFTPGPDIQSSPLTAMDVSELGERNKPGPPDEADQVVRFEVTTDNDDAFLESPEIIQDGTLSFSRIR